MEISEGRTNKYLAHGVFLIIGSIIFSLISAFISPIFYVLTIVSFITSILLFTASNGLELDPAKNRYRRYGKVGQFKFGRWISVTKPISAKLVLHSSYDLRESAYIIGAENFSELTYYKILTFDIIFLDSSNNSNLIYEFLKYKHAQKALALIESNFNIPVKDHVAEKLAKNKLNRPRR